MHISSVCTQLLFGTELYFCVDIAFDISESASCRYVYKNKLLSFLVQTLILNNENSFLVKIPIPKHTSFGTHNLDII